MSERKPADGEEQQTEGPPSNTVEDVTPGNNAEGNSEEDNIKGGNSEDSEKKITESDVDVEEPQVENVGKVEEGKDKEDDEDAGIPCIQTVIIVII